jgi:hypothetical protein
MNKYLIVKGCDGLGNRLYTLCNAIEYCKKNNRIILVDWGDGIYDEKNRNPFYDFFNLIGVNYIDNFSELSNWMSVYPNNYCFKLDKPITDIYSRNICSKIFSKISPRYLPKGILKKLHGHWKINERYGSQTTKSDLIAFKSLFYKDEIPLGGDYSSNIKQDIIIFGDSIPIFDSKVLIKNIQLKSWVKNEIEREKYKLNLSKRTIGVHIRNTDKKSDKHFSSIIPFLKNKLKDFDNIFLATDSEIVEKTFLSEFPNLIFTDKKYLSDLNGGLHLSNEILDKRKLLQVSIIDMWLLSSCGLLLYQGNSSFSRISKCLKQEDSFNWQKL